MTAHSRRFENHRYSRFYTYFAQSGFAAELSRYHQADAAPLAESWQAILQSILATETKQGGLYMDPGSASMSKLNREIATYNRHLTELLQQQGKFVLIKGDEVAGTFDSYQDALTAGYQRFKLDSFLVKQITAVEPVIFSRGWNIRRG